MPDFQHDIDLSSVTHRTGQSTDLEAKRQRAWARLSDEEKEWVIAAYELTGMISTAPAFREMQNAADRVLYVLVGTEESLTANELSYLMIARWFRNIDPATARAKMALLVKQGMARYTGIGRTMALEAGLIKLEDMANPGMRRRSLGVPDDAEPGRSNVGDYGAPRGRTREEVDADPRALSFSYERVERAPSPYGERDERDDRGGDFRGGPRRDDWRDDRGPRRDDDRRGDSRGGPRRDDRRDDSRGPRRDDRGGDSRGPRRDDRGPRSDDSRGDSRGPRRDDRRGDSRGPRRDDRRGDSRGPRRDDRGPRRDDRRGDSRGPRRDDRRSDSRGPRRDDRGGSSGGIRRNLDGPVIDGRESRERRVNTDGPRIDGKGEDA